MANLTQTLTDKIRFFGIQPSSKWGSPMKWQTDNWGDGTNTNFNMKTVSLSFFNGNSLTFADTFGAGFRVFNNDMATFKQNAVGEYLRDGSKKYFYVLPGGVTNDEQATVNTYTTLAGASNSWSLVTSAPASWVTS